MRESFQGRESEDGEPWRVSGAWRPGDPDGRRLWYAADKPLALEGGPELPYLRLAFETWGTLAPDASNAVLVLHALTGDSHVHGSAGPGHPTPGWWDGLVGPGRALDTDRYFVVAPNVLGGCQGSTGPASARTEAGRARPDAGPASAHPHRSGRAWGSAFPFVTPRDQVAAEAGLADALGIGRWALVVGGSMGGMRAVEWAVTHPARTGALLLLATTAAASAEQIAWSGLQIAAIRADPHWYGGDYHGGTRGPVAGLAQARRLAHVTYRTAAELQDRFGRATGAGGRFEVDAYLDHHAAKLVRRFDAASYVVLSESMNAHDVGRARGGVRAALSRVTAPALVAGVDSDRLYPLAQQRELAALIPGADRVRVIESAHGHDGFLTETRQVAALVAELLARG